MSVREIRKTESAKAYQYDLLTKDIRRLRRKFGNQISSFDQIIQTEEAEVVKQELVKLNRIFTDLNDASERLCKLISKEEATKINYEVGVDRENLENIEKAVSGWLLAQDKIERKSSRSLGSRKSGCPERNEQVTDATAAEMKVRPKTSDLSRTVELMQKHSTLENQLGLFDELLETNDTSLIKRETKKLKELYAEVCEVSYAIGSVLRAIAYVNILPPPGTLQVVVVQPSFSS